MKAIRVNEFGGPEVLRLEEVTTPKPGSGEVLVRIHAVGVNPVETYIRAGKYARLPELPYTPGNDGAGVVEKVGADVSEFKSGDRVYTGGSLSGTYAEFALCKKEQVHPLPANVSFAQGAAMGTPYASASQKSHDGSPATISINFCLRPGLTAHAPLWALRARSVLCSTRRCSLPPSP